MWLAQTILNECVWLFMVGKLGKRITWHYFIRQFILLIAVTAAISVPLVIANLFPIFQLVQTRGVPSIYLVKAFVLLFPLVLLLSIPVFVAISLSFSYDQYIRNNEITVLSAAGFSKFNLAAPGVLLSIASMLFSIVISIYLVPVGMSGIHDLKHTIRNYLSFRALPEGKYTELSNDIVIYIHNWTGEVSVNNIQIMDRRDSSNWRFIFSKRGHFFERNGITILTLFEGRINSISRGSPGFNSVKFARLSLPLPMLAQGGIRKRQSQFENEQTIARLLNPPGHIVANTREAQKWRGELFRRIAAPIMCVSYGFLCVGALLIRASPRRDRRLHLLTLGITVAVLYVVFFTFPLRFDMRSTMTSSVFLAIVVAPLIAGVILLLRADRSPNPMYKSVEIKQDHA